MVSHSGVRIWIPVASLLIQLSVNISRKVSEDGLSIWALATHKGDPSEFSSSWIQSDPSAATVAISGVNEQMEDLSLPHFLYNSDLQVN